MCCGVEKKSVDVLMYASGAWIFCENFAFLGYWDVNFCYGIGKNRKIVLTEATFYSKTDHEIEDF